MASSTDTFYTFFLCVYQNAYVEAKIFVFIDFFLKYLIWVVNDENYNFLNYLMLILIF